MFGSRLPTANSYTLSRLQIDFNHAKHYKVDVRAKCFHMFSLFLRFTDQLIGCKQTSPTVQSVGVRMSKLSGEVAAEPLKITEEELEELRRKQERRFFAKVFVSWLCFRRADPLLVLVRFVSKMGCGGFLVQKGG